MAKGYKLTSTSGDGPKTCAFFFSDKGCRTGANCKFSHVKTAPAAPVCTSASKSPPSVSSSSVCSSESESDGEIVEKSAGAYSSLGKTEVDIRPNHASINPFLAALPVAAPPAHIAVAAPPVSAPVAQPSTEKKKKKRKKSTTTPVAADGNPFDFGKAEIQSPVKNTTGTAAPPITPAAVAAPPAKKAKTPKQKAVAAPTTPNNISVPPSFRSLQLPVASFSLPSAPAAVTAATTPKSRPPSPQQHMPAPLPPPLPLPTATAAHRKWTDSTIKTRFHANYANAFNYERAKKAEFSAGISTEQDWITSRPYGPWCASNPAAIAIDCEMCETKDAVSGKVDTKALCRISVVNADNPSEVLLDTLVKPEWPVSHHRTWVNGITAKDLENVQMTLKHTQMFMAALCSDQTVIVGHAVHNDLLALRMVHHCNVDTAMLYTHADETDGTPSLKNLAHGVLQREMPDVHDSVNDARVALECAKHYVDQNGKVNAIEKVYSRSDRRRAGNSDSSYTATVLVHRLPQSTEPNHITEMFLAYSYIKPKNVPEITFSGLYGKVDVEFTSTEHANLAYDSLVGEEREDKTGKKQKRVGLKGGGYVCVRKMKKGK